ncbi:purine-nucleoside phosphorylase [Micromonospora aurantiaca]|uniref:purine-nucleoside phosphorylase n=1 Tax=Micromonospora TaxID=1873 RepID=UPI00064C2AD1|nr:MULTISPECIES: purine-nucleoside phosphorylase [unclassified Micromonospora]NED50115.1 purine-nucleoside phosphorylase [Micromonospora aurantiaca]AXO34300.1 purine nucleoside phosphorylase [Micromonospora sp. B006]MCO1613597.1 purine-nucleoside phosphorylase [Micromonospora sp. CPM1]MCZ7478116.1 purine-nucleoside phosphorylase [Micromonospora sp. WMMC273]MDG4754781.1 purine-nucleoside phosphorylase [Micromonospora sp. WMMD718]
MSTHIGAEPGEIAERVLMPGDPLRAKWIAETYLEGARCYTTVRGMLGFTGKWNGVDVSVQGSGMGMPSASIYAHELVNEYGVKSLIRVGSCGALTEDLQLRDVVAAIGSSTDSNMNRMRFDGLIDYAPVADFGLLRTSVEVAERRGISMRVGPILAADAFYTDRPDLYDRLADYGVLAVEMESAALYTIAARFKARALTILTVSDHIKTGEKTTSQEREQTFGQMVEIALDTIIA